MAEEARFRSPVAVRNPAGTGAGAPLVLTDETPSAKVLVRAAPAGGVARWLGVEVGWAVRDGYRTLRARFSADEWLLLAAPGQGGALVAALEGVADDGLVTVLDATSSRVLLRLSGAAAPDVLAKVCPVDAAAADGTTFRSFVAGIVAEVIRDDGGASAERSYLIACDWSYGQYLFDALADAGAEFGCAVRAN